MRNTIVVILALTSLLVVSCAAAPSGSGSNALLQGKTASRECRAKAFEKCQSVSPAERRECIITAQNACPEESSGGRRK